LNDALYQSTQQVNTRGYVAAIDSVLYADINDAGYNVQYAADSTFQSADSTSMQFLGDINGGGIPETVRYSMVRQIDSTYNLYRSVNTVNGGANLMMGNVASITFLYYDRNGVLLLTTDATRFSKIKEVRVVTVVGGNTTEFRIDPPNLL